MKNLGALYLFIPMLSYMGTYPIYAQLVDPTVQISNQVDVNNAETISSQTYQGIEVVPGPGQVQTFVSKPGSPYSGLQFPAPTGWKAKGLVLIEGFNEKNSFLGKGVTDAYSTQIGWTEQSPIGTTITPYINYQNSGTDLVGTNVAHSNGIGASLNISQKFFPSAPIFFWKEPQPGAVQNIGKGNEHACDPKSPYIPDHYSNFDIQTGLNLSFGDTNLATLKHGWAYDTQDAYGISPNLSFDFFRRQANSYDYGDPVHPSPVDKTPWLPAAINIVPTYTYMMGENQAGNSSSTGQLSIQDRNTYSWVLHDLGDCDHSPTEFIQLIESNTLLHDTNQEPLTPSPTPIRYQNWARFGLALAYCHNFYKQVSQPDGTIKPVKVASLPLLKVEYDYDAFNNQYEAHTVNVTANISF